MTLQFLLTICMSLPAGREQSPVELGSVSWGRDHAAAFARAKQTERPVLILFQEIPG